MNRKLFFETVIIFTTFASLEVSMANSPEDKSSLNWQFAYDDVGRITKISKPGGGETTISYELDDSKQFVQHVIRKYNDQTTVNYELDRQGRRVSMTDSAGTVSYGYDDLGRLNHVQRQGALAIDYTYDTLDRVTSLRVGDFYRIDYVYDFLGRLESMKTPAGVIQYEYQTGQGKLIRTLPNGVKTILDYEPSGRLHQIAHCVSHSPNDNQYELLAEYTYQYRPDSLIEAIGGRSSSGQFVKAYQYDTVGRLVHATGPNGQQYDYEYDQVGNRLKAASLGNTVQTCTYDWAGRMTTLNGNPCEYDSAGNLTSITVDGTSLQYRYNQDNQLADALDGKVIYQYDGEGRLILRKTEGVETTFIPDPLSIYWQPLVMTGKDGTRTQIIWEGATPLIMIKDNNPEYLLHDHLGSVRLVVDRKGNLTRQLDYEPFGTMVDSTMALDFTPGFSGLFWDINAKAYLAMARTYDSVVARFLQSDPLLHFPDTSKHSYSLYAYCGGDPVNFSDLNGAEAISCMLSDGNGNAVSGLSFHNPPLDAGLACVAPPLLGDNPPSLRDINNCLNQIPNKFYSPGQEMDFWPKEWQGKWHPSEYIMPNGEIVDMNWVALFSKQPLGLPGTLSNAFGSTIAGPYNAIFLPFKSGSWEHRITNMLEVNPRSQVLGLYIWAHQSLAGKNVEWETLPLFQKRYIQNQLTDSKVNPLPASATWHGASFQIIGRRATLQEIAAAKAEGRYYPVGINRDGLTRSNNILMSTTGPGKRGGRGGGITRPPGWPNPPGPQGNPPLGPQPKPGGPPPKGGQGSRSFALRPSTVGGVYLGGAGDTLAGLGLFEGISFDHNNNLVLIAKEGKEVNLPAFRVDDIVTVFRSVYLYGEGPSVTIDPSPENPEGPTMIIRHGKATENTYVGWVLYQADRLMKGYTLGFDNVTDQEIQSSVPDYSRILDTIYFGGDNPDKLRKEGYWERFWIVPAEVQRFSGLKKELTLFDVPLKVKTQIMKWEKGELVDDLKSQSSPGALAFTDWFTDKYDQIAGERFLTPPSETGITEPVPVFTELRRITLMTAIAEKLRDQGVPLPFWMRDYEVKPVPFEQMTPGLKKERSNQKITARIYGGVNLTPADTDVKDYTGLTHLSDLPKAEQSAVQEKIQMVSSLENTVQKEISSAEHLQITPFQHQGIDFQALVLPGAETQALAPCRMKEVDLEVPLEGGEAIQLVRRYNSFFNPTGPWGKGWALDLPRLQEIKVPVLRKADQTQYQIGYELITPLNDIYVRFSQIQEVPSLNNSQLQVPDQSCVFFGLADAKPDFLSGPTHQLIRKDGGVWYFSMAGRLVATEQGNFRTVYERDEKGRLTRIVGLQGRKAVAFIELGYDAEGRLDNAKTSGSGQNYSVRYEYDGAGKLSAVQSKEGTLRYLYKDSWVTDVIYQSIMGNVKATDEKTLHHFEYNDRGQLLAETSADGTRIIYRMNSGPEGTTITSQQDSSPATDSICYDPSFRPMKAQYVDGTMASWMYPEDGSTVLEFTGANGDIARITESADNRRRTLELNKQQAITAEYNEAGLLTSLDGNGYTWLEQDWYPDGKLRVTSDGHLASHLEYDQDGLITGMMQTPPDEQNDFSQWQHICLDSANRPLEITDYCGLQVLMEYDSSGELSTIVNQRDGKNYGATIIRDKTGCIQDVESSWGNQHYTYDTDGALKKMEVESSGKKAILEWQSGLIQKATQFDGGEIQLKYDQDPSRQGLVREIRMPNDLQLTYDYDEQNRLTSVNCGNTYRLGLKYDDQGRLVILAQSAIGEK
ncbi:MAG: hypothetical protein JXD22_07100 [Sedimentisphaerales bacterium]|nr:hypothetical protein [Sedimentisphaerales bacterium]